MVVSSDDIERVAVLGAGNMGHGITEVVALAGYDVVMRDIEDDIVQDGYDDIEWSLSKLAENGLIDEDPESVLSRIETEVDLESAVRDAWDALDATDAELTVGDSERVTADEQALTRLLDNLLGNALDHAGPEVSVTVETLPDGFAVADDGPGIPPGDRETVFEPGYSLAEDGTGFGLASVRQIALAHGWDVRVTESEAGGARFEVTDVTVLD